MRYLAERTRRIGRILTMNPALFAKKARARMLTELIPAPPGEVEARVGKCSIRTTPARNHWWKAIWLRCCAVEIEHHLRRCLGPSGVFLDVGSAIGYFAAMAADVVGESGQVHCFEPFPDNIRAMERMIRSNPHGNIFLNRWAAGADDAVHRFYFNRLGDTTMLSMIPGLAGPERESEVLEVRTRRLDDYLERAGIDEVSLIKIDVEGFEYHVLRGLEGFFRKIAGRPPIVCEITPPTCPGAGSPLDELRGYMGDHGYQAFDIFNERRPVDIRSLDDETDVIFRAA